MEEILYNLPLACRARLQQLTSREAFEAAVEKSQQMAEATHLSAEERKRLKANLPEGVISAAPCTGTVLMLLDGLRGEPRARAEILQAVSKLGTVAHAEPVLQLLGSDAWREGAQSLACLDSLWSTAPEQWEARRWRKASEMASGVPPEHRAVLARVWDLLSPARAEERAATATWELRVAGTKIVIRLHGKQRQATATLASGNSWGKYKNAATAARVAGRAPKPGRGAVFGRAASPTPGLPPGATKADKGRYTQALKRGGVLADHELCSATDGPSLTFEQEEVFLDVLREQRRDEQKFYGTAEALTLLQAKLGQDAPKRTPRQWQNSIRDLKKVLHESGELKKMNKRAYARQREQEKEAAHQASVAAATQRQEQAAAVVRTAQIRRVPKP
ncbi:ABC transporter ATP-binding [Chlorella sorokiniana]|uniref:ABC transporter ATP-binding n=1 Tax=Chlorella sorokiniana TaxID=3076 RepID=A0A2P6U2W4_CHLSO|nr:ABC transporter ATP-binding [Chlorella sorokiniana]|eukprot:PRW60651.1 ABC transporter ATP-binding [Chlorella sorokiniana]